MKPLPYSVLLHSMLFVFWSLPSAPLAAEQTATFTITKDDLGSADEFDLSFNIGGAQVTILHTDDELVIVQAVVTYDSSGPDPDMNTASSDGTFKAVFSSGYETYFNYNQFPGIQEWNISIGAFDVDTDLTIAGGGVEGAIDLGGLPLVSCNLAMGGVGVDIDFSTPTTRQVEKIDVTGGGITLVMNNIGNTDFVNFAMVGGGFIADLDFQGEYNGEQHNVSILGAGNKIKITVPSNTGEKVDIIAVGALATVSGSGWETIRKLFFFQNYITGDYESQGVTIDLDLKVAGSLVTIDRD